MDKITYLVIAAQEEELKGAFEGWNAQPKKIDNFDVLFFENENVVVYGAIGGIGKVSIAHCLTILIKSVHPDYVINTGVCGSIDKDLRSLEIFVAEKCAYHDVDVKAFGYLPGQMCKMPQYYECDSDLMKNILAEKNPRIKTGLILSGDSFITKAHINENWYIDFDHPIACDMESAAVGQVCHMEQIPFLIIRTVSDETNDGDNTTVYNGNLDDASRLAGKLVRKLIISNNIVLE